MERKPSPKRKLHAAILITICVAFLLTVALMIPNRALLVRSVSVRFNWEQGARRLSSISVDWPPFGSVYSRIVAVQAEPYIATYFENAGWRSAKGRLNLRTFCFFFVLGLDLRESWNVEIIDPEVTPLMHAAEDGNIFSTARLIREGGNVNAQDQRGWTALMHVAMNGGYADARALLAAGADPNVKDHEGRTAFLWAAWSCRSEVAKALIDAGSDVDAKDKYGSTALSSSLCPVVIGPLISKVKANP